MKLFTSHKKICPVADDNLRQQSFQEQLSSNDNKIFGCQLDSKRLINQVKLIKKKEQSLNKKNNSCNKNQELKEQYDDKFEESQFSLNELIQAENNLKQVKKKTSSSFYNENSANKFSNPKSNKKANLSDAKVIPQKVDKYSNHNQQQWINNVLCINNKQNTCETFYLPAYLRIKVKNIVSIKFQSFCAKLNVAIILSIYYGDLGKLKKKIINHIKKHTILYFNKGNVIKLGKKSLQIQCKDRQQDKLLNFTIRSIINAYIQDDVFWVPFDILKIILSIQMSCRSFVLNNNKKIKIKYNLMDCEQSDVKFSSTEENQFGVYTIAQNLKEVQYTNKRIYSKSDSAEVINFLGESVKQPTQLLEVENSQQIRLGSSLSQLVHHDNKSLLAKEKLSSFKYAHFVLALHRSPLPLIMKVLFPVLLLGIINLGIFFQDPKASGKKMINIAALMVSYISILPVIRQSIIENRKVSLMEILVFLNAFTCVFSMFQTIQKRNQRSQYEGAVKDDDNDNGFFIISLAINCIYAGVTIVMLFLHFSLWKPRYGKKTQSSKSFKFDRTSWYHNKCYEYFGKIKNQLNVKVFIKEQETHDKIQQQLKIQEKVYYLNY